MTINTVIIRNTCICIYCSFVPMTGTNFVLFFVSMLPRTNENREYALNKIGLRWIRDVRHDLKRDVCNSIIIYRTTRGPYTRVHGKYTSGYDVHGNTVFNISTNSIRPSIQVRTTRKIVVRFEMIEKRKSRTRCGSLWNSIKYIRYGFNNNTNRYVEKIPNIHYYI